MSETLLPWSARYLVDAGIHFVEPATIKTVTVTYVYVCTSMTMYQVRRRQHVYTQDISHGSEQESAAASYKWGNELLGSVKCSHFPSWLVSE